MADPWPDEYARRLRRLARELPPAEVPQEVRDAVTAYEAFFAAFDAIHGWRPDEGAGAAAQRAVDMLHAWTLYDVADGFIFPPDAAVWAAVGVVGGLPGALVAPAAAAPEQAFLRAALIAAAGAGGGAEGPTRVRALVEAWNDEAWARRATAALRALGVRGADDAVSDLRAVAARALNNVFFEAMQSGAAGATHELLCAAAERAAELNPRSPKISNYWAGLISASDVRRCHDFAAAAAERFAALRWEWARARMDTKVVGAFAAGALGPFTASQLRERVGSVRARLDACRSWAPHLTWRAVGQCLDHAARSVAPDLPGHTVMVGQAAAPFTLPTYRSCAACGRRSQEMPQCSRCRSAWYCSPACALAGARGRVQGGGGGGGRGARLALRRM